MKPSARDYEFRVFWDPVDEEFGAQVIDIPTLTAFAPAAEDAVRDLRQVLKTALEMYAADGEAPPVPGSRTAATLGHIGGKVSSARKRLAARRNGLKGGRPRKAVEAR